MTDRDALAQLTAALDAYFAAKGLPVDTQWAQAFNALMKALAEAKRVLASKHKGRGD